MKTPKNMRTTPHISPQGNSDRTATRAAPHGVGWFLAASSLAVACGEGGPGVEGTDYAIYEFGFGFQQLCYVVLVEERRAAAEQAVLWDYGPNVEECDPRIPEDAEEW